MTPKFRALVLAYKAVFGTEIGKLVLDDLCDAGHMTKAHLRPGAPIDKDLLLFNEARRMLVLDIHKMIDTNLEDVKPTQTINEETS